MVAATQTCYDALMAFVRWDPLRDLLTLHEQLGQLAGTEAPDWMPLVDLYETSSEFVLTAELPGLSRDDFDIQVEENRILIRGERPGQVPCEQYHRVERGHGRFARALALPEPIEVNAVSADLKEGVLTIILPKASGGGVRRISVR